MALAIMTMFVGLAFMYNIVLMRKYWIRTAKHLPLVHVFHLCVTDFHHDAVAAAISRPHCREIIGNSIVYLSCVMVSLPI